MDYSDLLAALKSLKQEQVTQKQGVMTDTGPDPENARAYTAILSGREPPEPGQASPSGEPPPTATYPAITSPQSASTSSVASPGQYESITTTSPAAVVGPIVAGQGPPEQRDPVPDFLKGLSDSELRQVINSLHGVKAGKKGSVGNRTKRGKLLGMATKALGYDTRKPEPPLSLPSTSEMATAGSAEIPGYESILAGSSAMPAESHVAGMGTASIPDPGPIPPEQPPSPASPLPPSLTSRADTGASGSGRELGQSRVTTTSPQATSRRVTAPLSSGSTESTVATASADQQSYNSILATAPVSSTSGYGTLTGSGLQQPPPLPGSDTQEAKESRQEPTKLTEAIKRLTDAISAARRNQERTVAQDTQGMSLGERMARLQKSGKLLSEDDVKAATLKEKVSPQDVVHESERQEQRERDQQKQARGKAVQDAAAAIPEVFGKSVTGFVSRIAGPKAGAAAGRFAQRGAGAAVKGFLTTGTAGGAARGVAMATLTNPVTALVAAVTATTVAFLKLPGVTEKFATSIMEGQRHLAKYNAQLMGAYARLDYQKRWLNIQQAQANSGSTARLGDELMKLRRETQWARETMGTAKNVAGTALATIGRVVNAQIQTAYDVKLLRWLAEKWERENRAESAGMVLSYLRGLSSMPPGPTGPMNKKPGEGNGNKGGGK